MQPEQDDQKPTEADAQLIEIGERAKLAQIERSRIRLVFQQEIDRIAMKQGLAGTDDYLDAWAWSAPEERPGGVELRWKLSAQNAAGEPRLRGWARSFHEEGA